MQSNKKKPQKSLASKISQVAQLLRSEMHKVVPLKKRNITPKPKVPTLSPANAIERISKMIRKEVQISEARKASGE